MSMELPTKQSHKTNVHSQTPTVETVHHVWAEVEGDSDDSKD